ncbi:MAG: hypothetical protein LUH11_03225 [Candidatus Gastranaerophilales bacterium]|nr:hypothetical protein [Candidatus Gastranaerophilales bacterium]
MLTFNLKKEWFDKIKSGEKTHEYREIKPYWEKRIIYILNPLNSRIVFRCGYSGEKLLATVKGITIRDGLCTDLKIDKPVYDIEFELIKGGKNDNK